MNERAMVIVGAGQAGGRAALTLREADRSVPIVLIGGEPYAPYERPPLSKAYLTGAKQTQDFTFASDTLMREAGIEWRHSTEVVAIERPARTVRLANGEDVAYERLLLATGRQPLELSLPGANLPGIFYLRDIDDARRLNRALSAGERVLVIGGGFIGLEVAASATAMGAQVKVVEAGPRLLMRAVPASLAAVIQDRHDRAGVQVMLESQVTAFHGEQRVREAELADGSRLPADVVVVGIGARPRDDLAREAGLVIERGVLVDETLMTDDSAIYAAGDACVYPHPLGGGVLRLESWQNADDQGAHAAHNMLGARRPYRKVPWFWSDQYDLVLQMAGYPDRGAETVERDVGMDGRLQFHFDRAGRLVAVCGVGAASLGRDIRIGQKLIEHGGDVSADVLADPHVKLKKVLKQVVG